MYHAREDLASVSHGKHMWILKGLDRFRLLMSIIPYAMRAVLIAHLDTAYVLSLCWSPFGGPFIV